MLTPAEETARTFRCRFCGRNPGECCWTVSGHVYLGHSHQSRYNQATWAGLLDG